MAEKVKTVIECYFLLPDFKSRGHPSLASNWARIGLRLGLSGLGFIGKFKPLLYSEFIFHLY